MRPARGFRLLALLLLAGATGSTTLSADRFSGTRDLRVDRELSRDFGNHAEGAAFRSPHGLAPTTAVADMPSVTHGPDQARFDRWLEQLWWVAFLLTASAYVLVLGALGIRRLRGGHDGRHAWAVPDMPMASARSRHVRPHL